MTRWAPLPVALLALVLAACAPALLQRQEEPAVRSYLLEWDGDAGADAAAASGPVLLVSPVLAAPGFDGSDMAYMRHPHQLEYFASHRWVDAPARMLDPLLVRAAARSGLFRGVVEAGSGARADLRLESRLLHLVQQCHLRPSELHLALRVALLDVPSGRVLATSTLRVSEPIAERSPGGGADAANRALDALLRQLQAFLAAGAARR